MGYYELHMHEGEHAKRSSKNCYKKKPAQLEMHLSIIKTNCQLVHQFLCLFGGALDQWKCDALFNFHQGKKTMKAVHEAN